MVLFFLTSSFSTPKKCAQKHGGNKDGSQKKKVKIQNMKTYWKKKLFAVKLQTPFAIYFNI